MADRETASRASGRESAARPASSRGAANTDDPSDDGKIFISYIVLGVVVTAFVLVTVALGLMAALINLPTCDDSSARAEPVVPRFRRDTLAQKDKLTIFKEFLDQEKEYPFCPELLESPIGQPWDSKRLPTNIVPIKYDIMLRTPIFATTFYNGESTIRIRVRQPTQYILMHSKFLADYLPTVKDAAGNELNIACTGDFLPHDYFIIKMSQSLSVGEYTIDLFFTGSLIAFSNGIFEVEYKVDDDEFDGNMLASHFEPVDARLAFPCFDEPEMKAIFSIRLYHPPGTTALSNMPALSEVTIDGEILTTFQDSPRLPVYLIAMLVFRTQDFSFRTITTSQGMPVRVWARTPYVEGGSVDGPVRLVEEIFNNFNFLSNEVPEAVPPKLDVFAIPYYPQDSVGHYGLFIFEEPKILFLEGNVQERTKQSIALEVAKNIATLWFGNYVTFNWWDELWLQESISDYLKYDAVSNAYPDWRVGEQFITEELIHVLVDDSYPSSHPVIKTVNSPEEIDQLFDSVERSKGAAILRMMQYEIGSFDLIYGLVTYLKKSAESNNGIGSAITLWEALNPIRTWTAREFAERWLLQANYPLLSVRIVEKNGLYYLNATQERFRSKYSIFAGEDLYPSPFDEIWYIPLTCTFGITPTDGETYDGQFTMGTKTIEMLIGDGTTPYRWVHCDTGFFGYYMLDYTVENWDLLGQVMKADNENLSPPDRANIIHNLFINTFNGKTSYIQLAKELAYLKDETDYLPWKTAVKHVSDLADILEHRRSFLQLSQFFIDELKGIEYSTDLWQATGNHIEELKRETILEFACRMQDPICLNNATNLWYQTFPTTSLTNAITLAPHVRSVVFNYHLQNTYNTGEWQIIVLQYDQIPDIQDRELLVQAASYSRLPWSLYRYLEDITTSEESFSKLNFFYTLELLAKNPLGRDIAWNYYRANYAQIVGDFGYENPEIGSTLISVVKTFSDNYSYLELISFFDSTSDEANGQARQRAIEIVSSNMVWIEEKEDEIIEAFGGIRRDSAAKASPIGTGLKNKIDAKKLKMKLREQYDEKFTFPLIRKKTEAKI